MVFVLNDVSVGRRRLVLALVWALLGNTGPCQSIPRPEPCWHLKAGQSYELTVREVLTWTVATPCPTLGGGEFCPLSPPCPARFDLEPGAVLELDVVSHDDGEGICSSKVRLSAEGLDLRNPLMRHGLTTPLFEVALEGAHRTTIEGCPGHWQYAIEPSTSRDTDPLVEYRRGSPAVSLYREFIPEATPSCEGFYTCSDLFGVEMRATP